MGTKNQSTDKVTLPHSSRQKSAVMRIGIDENGLGSRLGPMIVTSVLARVSPETHQAIDEGRGSEKSRFLDDSKRLVSHHDVRLGEAWARVLVDTQCDSPASLIEALTLSPVAEMQEKCPSHVKSQCWSHRHESFSANDDLITSVQKEREKLAANGVELTAARSLIHCTRQLNERLAVGHHRFLVDLHSMEQLVMHHQSQAKCRIVANCGKVGGITDYPKFFGPLSGRLHSTIEQHKSRAVYDFPGIGELRFEKDADASDPLVMIASLVGKYLRELFMHRISSRYSDDPSAENRPSGYHDPVTNAFVLATTDLRKERRIPFDCFERRRAT